MFKLVQLFNAESHITMFNFGKFIFNSMKLRSYTTTRQYILCVTCIMYTYTPLS